MNTITKDLGAVTAYAVAVANGYTGTEAQWAQQLAGASQNAQAAAASAAQASQSATDAAAANTAAQTAKNTAEAAAATASAAYGTDIVADNYSASKTYSVGEFVIYSGDLYCCKSAITTAEAWTAAHWTKVNLAKEVGSLKSALNSELLDKIDIITPTNWYNSAAVTSGKVMGVNGVTTDNSDYSYTDYIPVSAGEKIGLYRGDTKAKMYMYKVAAFNESKEAVSASGRNTNDNSLYTVPSGIAYVIVTIKNTNLQYSPMICKGADAPTVYSAYFEPYKKYNTDFLTPSSLQAVGQLANGTLRTTGLVNGYGCALPKTRFYQTVGLPQTWYKKSMVTPETDRIFVAIGTEYGTLYNNKIVYGNESEVSSANGYRWSWYDALMALAQYTNGPAGYGWSRRILAENLSDCSLLAIGDSTVDQDIMTSALLSHFTAQEHTLTLLGTLGSGDNKNEGRAGWKAADYFTDKQYNGVTNPFYNPSTQTFDFTYYMTQQGYSGVDFVVIQLGINDLYGADTSAIEPLWGNISGMIDSVLAYNNTIKIILDLPTAPNSDQSEHTVFLPAYLNRVILYNEYAQAHALSEYGTTKVRCSYCHLILDPDTDIRDNVHPTDAGYGKMALEIVNQINCWQAGE